MGHGCHVCDCPNGCECDEYAFGFGDWVEAKDRATSKIRRASDNEHVAALRARYGDLPGEVTHRYLKDSTPWYFINGTNWSEGELKPADKSRIPSENAAHVCGMFCDGQDGSTSDCARRRRNAQSALESRKGSFIVLLNYSDHFSGASEGSPARLCEGKLGYTVGDAKTEKWLDGKPAWKVRVPELDGHRECGKEKIMTIHWPHESLTFLGERDAEPLAPLRQAYELQEAATDRKATGVKLTGSAAEIARASQSKTQETRSKSEAEPTRFNLLEID